MDCNISYIHSKLRMIQRGKLRLHKSFKHKETTLRDKSKAISKSNIKTCNEKKETRKKKKKKRRRRKRTKWRFVLLQQNQLIYM